MPTILYITDILSGSRVPQLEGMRAFASTIGWHVEVIEQMRIKSPLKEVVSYFQPIGCVLESSGEYFIPPEKVGRLPVVYIDPPTRPATAQPLWSVSNDDVGIAELAFSTLALTAGAQAYAFIGWTGRDGWSCARERAFCRRAEAIGRHASVFTDPWTMGNKHEFIGRVRSFLASLPKETGIFTANDDIALVVLDACEQEGLVIPGDLYLIGTDDDPRVCDFTRPTLTSVRPNFHRAGYTAAELLAKRIAHPRLKPQQLHYPPIGVTRRLSTRRTIALLPRDISQALDLIHREACSGLKPARVIASVFKCSERSAEMRFKAIIGKRISEEITDVRFERVFQLLLKPDQAIEPIANLCGWESPVYLKRKFKERTGMTMRAWRKENLKKIFAHEE